MASVCTDARAGGWPSRARYVAILQNRAVELVENSATVLIQAD